MAVDVGASGEALQQGVPRLALETSLSRLSSTSCFDVSSDGKRLALLKEPADAGPIRNTHVTLIFNFFSDVRRAFAKPAP